MQTPSHSGDFDGIHTRWFDSIDTLRAVIHLLAKEVLILPMEGVFDHAVGRSGEHDKQSCRRQVMKLVADVKDASLESCFSTQCGMPTTLRFR
jgi:hypothetical protein